MRKELIVGIMFLFVINLVSGLYIPDVKMNSLGHFMRVQNISFSPDFFSPGEVGLIKLNLINNGNSDVKDLRIKLVLPDEFSFYKDVDTVKLSELDAMESKSVEFRVIAVPNANEGVHNANLSLNYVSYFGSDYSNVGDENSDNFVFGIVIKNRPDIFVQIDDTKIYKGHLTGDVSFKFVNNEIADARFFTVELEESEDYEIISEKIKYIGDLDSDDFDSVSFKIKSKKKSGEIVFPLKLNYKDAMNKEYEDRVQVGMKLRSAEDLGLDDSMTGYYIVGLIVLGLGGWWFWKKFRKGKKKGENR